MLTTEAAILERLLEPGPEELTSEVARYLLCLDLRHPDRQRLEELTAKKCAGTLTPAEETDLAMYQHVREVLARIQAKTCQALECQAPAAEGAVAIPAAIRRSQEAFWRELPQLFAEKKRRGQWVAYHRDEWIGFGRTETELYHECFRRGLQRDEVYVGRLEPSDLPPWGTLYADRSFFEASDAPGSEAPGTAV